MLPNSFPDSFGPFLASDRIFLVQLRPVLGPKMATIGQKWPFSAKMVKKPEKIIFSQIVPKHFLRCSEMFLGGYNLREASLNLFETILGPKNCPKMIQN
jgi:hypothetical protein